MKTIKFIYIFLILVLGAAAAKAETLTIGETDISPAGEAYEVNLGSDGQLYLSDYSAKQVWRINPTTDAVALYQLAQNVVDARPRSANEIWWTDGSDIFGRINLANNPPNVIYWTMPEGANLWGTAFDPENKLWLTEWFGGASFIYRFDPVANTYCAYQLYKNDVEIGGAQSYYILYDQGKVWVANWGLRRIIRMDPVAEENTWWQIPEAGSIPRGIALDGDGHLWWADEGLGALVKLDPGAASNQALRYDLPAGEHPKSIMIDQGAIRYTEFDETAQTAGTFGILDPPRASPTTMNMVTGTSPVDVYCNQLAGPGTVSSLTISTPALTWGSLALDPVVENEAWTIFQLPTTGTPGRPYGIALGGTNIWMSDQGRQKLLRYDAASTLPNQNIYLPVIFKQ